MWKERILNLLLLQLILSVTLLAGSDPRPSRYSIENLDLQKKSVFRKGSEMVTIVGLAEAISQETVIESEAASADLMILKVEKVLEGKNPGRFLRADFNHESSAEIAPEKALKLRQLLLKLRNGQVMKIHLRPPKENIECRWTIPPPPGIGQEIGFESPVMVPVDGAKGYPDINDLPCYAFELQDIEDPATIQARESGRAGGVGIEQFDWHIRENQPHLFGYHLSSDTLVEK